MSDTTRIYSWDKLVPAAKICAFFCVCGVCVWFGRDSSNHSCICPMLNHLGDGQCVSLLSLQWIEVEQKGKRIR